MPVIESNELTKTYGRLPAINNLSFNIKENKITGLIGRNGAGKTTLLKTIAGFLKPTSGKIKVFSENPFNSLKVSANLIFIDDNMNLALPSLLRLVDILESAGRFYPNWDRELATRLFDYFDFDPRQRHRSLSKGMRSTFNMIIGLSARCALTILDEPTTGMDAAVRKDFYKALLKDYIAYPRTIIVSSHLLSEIEDVLEDILLLKDGEKCVHLPVSELKELAVGLRGRVNIINELARGRQVYYSETFGKDSIYIVVKNEFTEAALQSARLAGVEITPVAVDDLSVYLTARSKGGIDNVFKRN